MSHALHAFPFPPPTQTGIDPLLKKRRDVDGQISLSPMVWSYAHTHEAVLSFLRKLESLYRARAGKLDFRRGKNLSLSGALLPCHGREREADLSFSSAPWYYRFIELCLSASKKTEMSACVRAIVGEGEGDRLLAVLSSVSYRLGCEQKLQTMVPIIFSDFDGNSCSVYTNCTLYVVTN